MSDQSEILRNWENSLTALAGYCRHYGLDDDDEAQMRSYLDYCARKGRPPIDSVKDIIQTLGDESRDDTPNLYRMTLPNPQWHWSCFASKAHTKRVKSQDLTNYLQQLTDQIRLDLHQTVGSIVNGNYLVKSLRNIHVQVIETPGRQGILPKLKAFLFQIRTFQVIIASEWLIQNSTPISGTVMNEQELLSMAARMPVPDSMILGEHHKITLSNLISSQEEVLVEGVKHQESNK